MANQKKDGKKKDKHDAGDEQDQFVSTLERIVEKLRPHAKPIAAVTAIVVVVFFAITMYGWWQNRKREHATAAWERAVMTAEKPVRVDGEEPDPDKDEYANNKERLEAFAAELASMHSEHGGTEAVGSAALLHASTLFQLNRYDEARAAYERAVAKAATEPQRVAAQEGVGYALEGLARSGNEGARAAGLEQALAAFRAMQPKDGGFGKGLALFHEARLLASLNKTSEARAVFEKVLAASPNGDLRVQVDNRLAALPKAPPETK